MISSRMTRAAVRFTDWLALKVALPDSAPAHQRTGRRGEEDAYFYLRRLGYVIVSRNYRSSRRRGEIDMIGWDRDVICFVEVKSRTSHDVKPAEAAVGYDKQRELISMANEYLKHLSPSCQWRFDVVSVYYENSSNQPLFELFRNAFPVA